MKEYIPGRRREIYVRDAQGNVLAVYEAVGESLFTKEYYLYGVQRLGYLMERRYLGRRCSRPPCIGPPVVVQRILGLPPGIGRPSVVADDGVELWRGSRRYELSDWLGNVRVVVMDARVPVRWRGVVVGYRAEVVGVGEYYSYGAEIGGRGYGRWYRWGFGGHEGLHEVRSGGHVWDMGARWLDGRLGRTFAVDTMGSQFPWITPYSYANANPIRFIDPDGKIVVAMDEASKENIMGTLRAKDRKYVRFDREGRLDVHRLSKAKSDSENLRALLTLAKSEVTYRFVVSSSYPRWDEKKNQFVEGKLGVNEEGVITYGVTLIPGASGEDRSPNEEVWIYVGSSLPKWWQVKTTAHEAYGHAYFYELQRQGVEVDPFHRFKGRLEGDIIYLTSTNEVLERQIKAREGEALNNFFACPSTKCVE